MKTLLIKDTWISIAKGAGLAATGAAATYLLIYFTALDWGAWTPIATALFAVIANILRKFGLEER
jgi:hypothetical protein